MKWIKITNENLPSLKPGNWIKYHDGFEWCERTLSEFNCDSGYFTTGNQGETRDLVNRRDNKLHDVFVAEESLLQNMKLETNNQKLPVTPRFLFAPDPLAQQLYIIHTQDPLAIIWVNQTIPAQLLIVECEFYTPGTDDQQAAMDPDQLELLEDLLTDAAEWYRSNAIEKSN